MTGKLIIALSLALVVLAALYLSLAFLGWADVEVAEGVCTTEAKLCPDGSYVGRVPPSCVFAPCP